MLTHLLTLAELKNHSLEIRCYMLDLDDQIDIGQTTGGFERSQDLIKTLTGGIYSSGSWSETIADHDKADGIKVGFMSIISGYESNGFRAVISS